MTVKRGDAIILMKDICHAAMTANARHIARIAASRHKFTLINVAVLILNTFLGSTLWASVSRDAPVAWVKYMGLALSVIATLVSGMALVLGLADAVKQSLEAAKIYGDIVSTATQFRMSLSADDPLTTATETKLFEIYSRYNTSATKYEDQVVALLHSTWSVTVPADLLAPAPPRREPAPRRHRRQSRA